MRARGGTAHAHVQTAREACAPHKVLMAGTGAESAIEDQVRAAGMNMIIVTAGNYKNKTADDLGAIEAQEASGVEALFEVAQGAAAAVLDARGEEPQVISQFTHDCLDAPDEVHDAASRITRHTVRLGWRSGRLSFSRHEG